MGNVIHFDFINSNGNVFINHNALDTSLIKPRDSNVVSELAVDHTSEPIKNVEDIYRISSFLLEEGRYRDYMLFIVGINFGLRVSDLLQLRFSDIINDNLTFKDCFAVLEKKTKNTRKVKKNRYISINQAVVEAVTIYLKNTPGICLSDYLFVSESNHGGGSGVPLHRVSVDRILKGIAKDVGLNIKMSTHTLRKTFAYHQMVMSNNDPRKLLLLQKMFGHSSVATTLDYIGITGEEIEQAYKELNLGSTKYNYVLGTNVYESTTASA